MPLVFYLNQEVPPPLNAWVAVGASDADLLFEKSVADYGLCVCDDGAKTSLTSNLMHKLLRQAGRLTKMQGFAQDVTKLVVKEAAVSATLSECSNLVVASQRKKTLLDANTTASASVKMTEDWSEEM